VFVLSLENRSFDHLFGRSGIKGKDAETKAPGKSINGVLDANGNIDPQYTNSYEPTPAERARGGLRQTFGIPNNPAPFIMPSDPKHEFEHILCQTCGPEACRKLFTEFGAAPSSFKLNKPDDSFYDTVPPPSQSQPWFVRFRDATSPGMAEVAHFRPKSVSDRPAPNNSGFVQSYVRSFSENSKEKADAVPDIAAICQDPRDVMRCFDTQRQLPILYRLASKFLICDNFFSSLPGPTGPNRFFMMAGSSAGYDGGPSSGEMKTFSTVGHLPLTKGNIFTQLAQAGVPFGIFGDDDFPMAGVVEGVSPWNTFDVHLDPAHPRLFIGSAFSSLEVALKSATDAHPFPYNFVWIEPDYDVLSSMVPGFKHPIYSTGNSMHPCSDVRKAEKLIRDIYNWIAGNKSVWRNCVIFITWDEHGGFYDHVPSPTATPPGDSPSVGRTWNFKFDRLGTRVPCLVISPFIESNLIDSRQYDHCSILKTVIDLHNRGAFNKGLPTSVKLKPWTDRIRDAASMIGLFTQDAAKAVPVSLGTPLEPAAAAETSGDQSPSHNPPSGNILLFLASAINLHKAADPSLDVPSLVASLTTDEAVGKYFAQAAAAIDSAQEQGANQQVA
jgi:phospholipase C